MLNLLQIVSKLLKYKNFSVSYAIETDKALAAVSPDADWAVYIQGDEVLHEDGLPALRQAMKEALHRPEIEGLLLSYRHFYAPYDYVGNDSRWYPMGRSGSSDLIAASTPGAMPKVFVFNHNAKSRFCRPRPGCTITAGSVSPQRCNASKRSSIAYGTMMPGCSKTFQSPKPLIITFGLPTLRGTKEPIPTSCPSALPASIGPSTQTPPTSASPTKTASSNSSSATWART